MAQIPIRNHPSYIGTACLAEAKTAAVWSGETVKTGSKTTQIWFSAYFHDSYESGAGWA